MKPCEGSDLWVSENAHERAYAARVCLRDCPLVDECRKGAYERQERFAVWGGVDHSFGSTSSGFTCGVAKRCNRTVAGYGHRGDLAVPACDLHVDGAKPIVKLNQQPGRRSYQTAEGRAEQVADLRERGLDEAAICEATGIGASALAKALRKVGMIDEARCFEQLSDLRRRQRAS